MMATSLPSPRQCHGTHVLWQRHAQRCRQPAQAPRTACGVPAPAPGFGSLAGCAVCQWGPPHACGGSACLPRRRRAAGRRRRRPCAVCLLLPGRHRHLPGHTGCSATARSLRVWVSGEPHQSSQLPAPHELPAAAATCGASWRHALLLKPVRRSRTAHLDALLPLGVGGGASPHAAGGWPAPAFSLRAALLHLLDHAKPAAATSQAPLCSLGPPAAPSALQPPCRCSGARHDARRRPGGTSASPPSCWLPVSGAGGGGEGCGACVLSTAGAADQLYPLKPASHPCYCLQAAWAPWWAACCRWCSSSRWCASPPPPPPPSSCSPAASQVWAAGMCHACAGWLGFHVWRYSIWPLLRRHDQLTAAANHTSQRDQTLSKVLCVPTSLCCARCPRGVSADALPRQPPEQRAGRGGDWSAPLQVAWCAWGAARWCPSRVGMKLPFDSW